MHPNRVHLVGSIGLPVTVPELFQRLGERLGRRLTRVPDGEPGPRLGWMNWQYLALRFNPWLELDPDAPPIAYPGHPLEGVRPLRITLGADRAAIRFGELGYAREARTSYTDFIAARSAGTFSPEARFQVCLPSPNIVPLGFCIPADQGDVAVAYERAMLAEVAAIAAAVPHQDLCIQWDCPSETMAWDGRLPMPADRGEITGRLARLCDAVPEDVELGFHLCYGDPDQIRAFKPLDTGAMVDMINTVAAAAARPITYVHMPAPAERLDDAYFAPLAGLDRERILELQLGMVHSDGPERMAQRIAAAGRYATDFGVGTECGMGRLRSGSVEGLLEAHAAYAQAPQT